jgi:hypothetical protein
MKKLVHIISVCGLVGILCVGCGEKKSAGVIKCEEQVTEIWINMPKKLHDSGEMSDDIYQKAMVNGECAVKACALYEGGASDEEMKKFMSSGFVNKSCQ